MKLPSKFVEKQSNINARTVKSVFRVDFFFRKGCLYESSLCSAVEVCIDDGLFGRCQQEPFDLYQYALSDDQALVFSGELEKLVGNGADWGSPATQCTLLYVMMVQRFAWNYHPEFCTVGDDTKKVWQALRVYIFVLAN